MSIFNTDSLVHLHHSHSMLYYVFLTLNTLKIELINTLVSSKHILPMVTEIYNAMCMKNNYKTNEYDFYRGIYSMYRVTLCSGTYSLMKNNYGYGYEK